MKARRYIESEQNLDKCMFCGKSRFKEFKDDGKPWGDKLWQSDFALLMHGTELIINTVCRECRPKHTIEEFLVKA